MMSTRRESNRSFWLGRTAATALMVLVGLGVFAGSAAAQGTTFYEFTDAEAWWEYFDCDEMRVILGTGGDGTNAIVRASEAIACKPMLDGLTRANQRIIENFIEPVDTTSATNDNVSSMFSSTKLWWNAVGDETSGCEIRQKLAGVLPIAATDAATGAEPMLFCADYDGATGLRSTQQAIVADFGMALSGRTGMATDEEEAPALPLAGLGILGLLLAGRGAWLRRRRNG